MQPIVAGRNEAQVAAVAARYGLPYRVAALDDPAGLDALLQDIAVVLHCAGPFVDTATPMVNAGLRNRVHYLDITGENICLRGIGLDRNNEARQAGILSPPGAGFDVVPFPDRLAASISANGCPPPPGCRSAIRGIGRIGRGTTLTALEGMRSRPERDGAQSRASSISTPPAWQERLVDFGNGPRATVTVPWGDVFTAYYSTGIPDIEVYMSLSPAVVQSMKLSRHWSWLPAAGRLPLAATDRIRSGTPGATDAERANGKSLLWGRVEDDAGNAAEARLRTPEGYTFTALASLQIARNVLSGHFTSRLPDPRQRLRRRLDSGAPRRPTHRAVNRARASLQRSSNKIACTCLGPCTPSVRFISMSADLLGPGDQIPACSGCARATPGHRPHAVLPARLRGLDRAGRTGSRQCGEKAAGWPNGSGQGQRSSASTRSQPRQRSPR
jgi:short subunit dehydrogenase-like uncharacterized protein